MCKEESEDLVIGRYSVLPNYSEVYYDILNASKLRLVNSPSQHAQIADITRWYEVLSEYTPKTYTMWGDLGEGKWIVKGRTNSKKQLWCTHMFCEGRDGLLRTVSNLLDDTFISEQGLVVREYVPLRTFGQSITGLPISNEYRFFFYKDRMIAHGFYWSEHPDFEKDTPMAAVVFAKHVAEIVYKKLKIPFYVLDIAEKEDGGWIMIEMNDGQQSGTCCIDLNSLYSKMARII
jgi:hypothetical protein